VAQIRLPPSHSISDPTGWSQRFVSRTAVSVAKNGLVQIQIGSCVPF
jgi:hypothetical protein